MHAMYIFICSNYASSLSMERTTVPVLCFSFHTFYGQYRFSLTLLKALIASMSLLLLLARLINRQDVVFEE